MLFSSPFSPISVSKLLFAFLTLLDAGHRRMGNMHETLGLWTLVLNIQSEHTDTRSHVGKEQQHTGKINSSGKGEAYSGGSLDSIFLGTCELSKT